MFNKRAFGPAFFVLAEGEIGFVHAFEGGIDLMGWAAEVKAKKSGRAEQSAVA